MRNLFAIDLSAVRIRPLQSLADDGVELYRGESYWLEEHGDVIVSCDCVCYHVFEALDWVFSLAGAMHKVGVHAAGKGGVLEGCPRHHRFYWEGYLCKVEIATDDLFAD